MATPFPFACPRCHSTLTQTAPDELCCAAEGLSFQRIDGAWRFLLPERAGYFAQFIREYETIRQAEGRGSQDAAYYRSLPYRDLSGRMSADWRIRAASFDAFLRECIVPAERQGRRLRALDLGAGNGWLSNRLAARGHAAAAVDLMVNDFDGLGCQRYYETAFVPVQAEFDRLPFPAGAADLILFNSSLHYAVHIDETLREALRVLDAAGRLVIMDSPVYRDAGSGERMVHERERSFVQRFGFPSNSLPSQNYLTYRLLDELARALNVDWRIITPAYGIGWMLRPLRARLSRGDREPAKFHVIIGTRATEVAATAAKSTCVD